MNFVKHPQHTLYMGAPEDWNEATQGPCGALSIFDMRGRPLPKMESAWVPEGYEGMLLALGSGQIRLNIIGQVHPPVSMHVAPVKVVRTDEENLELFNRVLRDLAEAARDVGLTMVGGTFIKL